MNETYKCLDQKKKILAQRKEVNTECYHKEQILVIASMYGREIQSSAVVWQTRGMPGTLQGRSLVAGVHKLNWVCFQKQRTWSWMDREVGLDLGEVGEGTI